MMVSVKFHLEIVRTCKLGNILSDKVQQNAINTYQSKNFSFRTDQGQKASRASLAYMGLLLLRRVYGQLVRWAETRSRAHLR